MPIAISAVCIGVFFLVTHARSSYQQYERDVKTGIQTAYNQIREQTITPQARLEFVENIIGRTNESRWFKFRNSNSMGILFLTRGIVLDSLHREDEAAQAYQDALRYSKDDGLRKTIQVCQSSRVWVQMLGQI